MSTASAKRNNKKAAPGYITSGRGAVLHITLGAALLTMGLAFLLSMVGGNSSVVLRYLAGTARGLGGVLAPGIPFLMCWGGVKLMVSARHKVAVRDILLVSCIYLLLLACFTLLAMKQENGRNVYYLATLSRFHSFAPVSTAPGYFDYLRMSYDPSQTGHGGMLGMLIAYPLWQVLSNIGGFIMALLLVIILVLLLLKINPGDMLRNMSDASNRRQQRKRTRTSAQDIPVQPYDDPQNFYPAEEQPAADAPYEVASRYENTDFYSAASHAQQIRYRQPLQDDGTLGNYEQAAPYPTIASAAADPQQALYPDPKPAPKAAARISRKQPTKPAAEPLQPIATEPEPPPDRQPVPPSFEPMDEAPLDIPANLDKQDTMYQEETAEPIQNPPAWETPAEPQPKQPNAADDLPPWLTPSEAPPKPIEDKKPKRTRSASQSPPAPPAPIQAPTPAPSSWASQVQQRKADLDAGRMPEHTTQWTEPKPVYTDPVMPITGEKIPISPRRERKTDASDRLDGTTPPKVTQTKMNMPVRYQAPPIHLLNESQRVPQADSAREDEMKAKIIEKTLETFKVDCKVRNITHGPSITRFALQLAPGIMVNKVTAVMDNISLELKEQNVRMELPIPNTNFIGIEVPNQLVSTVSLREVLNSPAMRNSPSPLMVALGQDVAGAPVLCNLAKMPHLLIAGATGSGKSVCINSIVCSLLYRTSPDQVRMIMIDPKQVELSAYNTIPHLLLPVITDPRKAAGALAWTVQEMTERYGKFSAIGVRNMEGYNKAKQGTDEVLPNIVVIIDEMADLMDVCRKDVEESIRRLAALARAAGIYLVLATQRPSVDVITGVIKNNIPSRIAFAVSSGADSRTILDLYGAEKLMGKGDMLYKPQGGEIKRVQGCFVSDEEVAAITDYIGKHYNTDFDPNILEQMESCANEATERSTLGEEDAENKTSDEEVLKAAIEMAVEDGSVSVSGLQRTLRLGHSRAGRIVDEMTKRGIVSPAAGSKPRKTLISREQYYELYSDD